LNNVGTNSAGNYTLAISSPYGSVTSSIVTLTVFVRPSISMIVPQPDGSVTLNCSGGAGDTYLVQATTDLTMPTAWQTLSTNIADANGTWQFTDTSATNFPMRFYRCSTP
jgi:hypothetical protein